MWCLPMSLEKFCSDLDKEIRALKAERSKPSSVGQIKGAFTRRINALEITLTKATRKGIKE